MSFVFVSYSREDKRYAQLVTRALEERGTAAWMDERIDCGARWPSVLQRKINECAAFVVVLTPASEESEWVQNELQYAKRKGKPIFPLLLAGEVWLALAATQCVDVRGGTPPPEALLAQIGRVVSGRAEKRPGQRDLSETELHILRLIRTSPHRVSAGMISQTLRYPHEQVTSAIGSLRDKGYIRQDRRDKVPWSHEDATFFTEQSRREQIDNLLDL